MIQSSIIQILQDRYPRGKNQLEIYLALGRVISGQDPSSEWKYLMEVSWEMLHEMVHREQVAPLLHWRWKTADIPGNVPAWLRQGLAGAWLRSCGRFERQDRELHSTILPALAGLKKPPVLLKGGALARSLYHEPGLRPMTDLDLLVEADDLAQAVQQLEKAGYVENRHSHLTPGEAYLSHHVVMIRPQAGVMVEIHHRLTASRDDGQGLDTGWFMDNIEPLLIRGQKQLFAFNPAAQLLHLAVHLMMQDGEGESDLLHFYDIHLLLDRRGGEVEWDRLVKDARRMDLDYALLAALNGCAERFNTQYPNWLAATGQAGSSGGGRRMVEARRGPRPTTNTGRYLRQLTGRPVCTRMGLLVRFLFPAPEFMRLRYRLRPEWLWPLSYPVRWGIGLSHLVEMAVGKLRK